MRLTTHSFHNDKKLGELFLGHFSQWHIKNLVPWESKRIGQIVSRGKNKGKHPLFIMRNEAVDLGWKIG